MVSEEWGDWLLVTPVYPLRRGHDEYPLAGADAPPCHRGARRFLSAQLSSRPFGGGGRVRLHGWTWAALAFGTLILLAANLWCWRPGIGGGRPARAPGTEVELYYGWPATYRAEWWRSGDPALGGALLERAPFFHPAGVTERQVR